MYTEVNNYAVYDENFLFPIEPGVNQITIDCDSLGGDWTLYPQMDIWQGIACMGTWVIIETTFTVYESWNLILEDYINNTDVSFGTITIEQIEDVENEHIFNNDDNLLDFYIVEWVFLLLITIFICFKKIFYNLKR